MTLKKILPIDLNGVSTYPISERKSIVNVSDFSAVWQKGSSLKYFIDCLPNILAARDFKSAVRAVVDAYGSQKPILIGMGAHVIKVGLSPIIIDLMKRHIISGIAMNGAGIIHDFEIALTGSTSEDVAESIGTGAFGMAHETAVCLSEAIRYADAKSLGLGQAVGKYILDQKCPFADKSILAAGAQFGVPVTVHIAIGTDIIHIHPEFDPNAAGGASHRDFRVFASMVADLEGGVYINIGSAVILPEVFLKAVTLVRNLGYSIKKFTTVNMDFMKQYRPFTNVVNRPTAQGGIGYNLIGHHELMLPLFAAAIIEMID